MNRDKELLDDPFGGLEGNYKEKFDEYFANAKRNNPTFKWNDFNVITITRGKSVVGRSGDSYYVYIGYDQYNSSYLNVYATNKPSTPLRNKIIPLDESKSNLIKIAGSVSGTTSEEDKKQGGGIEISLSYNPDNNHLDINSGFTIPVDSGSIANTLTSPYLIYSTAPVFDTNNNDDIGEFVGSLDSDRIAREILDYVSRTFLKLNQWRNFRLCNNKYGFIYYDFPMKDYDNKKVCMTYNWSTYNSSFSNAIFYGCTIYKLVDPSKKQWQIVKKVDNNKYIDNIIRPDVSDVQGNVYFNDIFIRTLNETGKNTKGIFKKPKFVTHPRAVENGYDCGGNAWTDGPQDSSLAGPIRDLLQQHKKTFYLLGMQNKETEPKLYLFDLGNVRGGLTYTHIEKAIRYKNEGCKWVPDTDTKPDKTFKFSKAPIGSEVDTNFYLLTMDKLDKPTPIISISQRKANEYLLKFFKTCTINRPEGKPNPDENLKPEWGGGGGGTGPDGSGPPDDGSGGFYPDINRPLPAPDVPPCIEGVDGSGQTPVSEIKLLRVHELSPSYENTYDFPTIQDQYNFFNSKSAYTVSKYSYLRKDNAIQIGSHVDNIHCYNYLMYRNKLGKWYYCFIMNKEYINERTCRITIATDVIQTYLFDYKVGPCYVERCHVDRWKSDKITPTNEYELEGLEFGEPVQESNVKLYDFKKTIIAVTSTPLGEIDSRSKEEKP